MKRGVTGSYETVSLSGEAVRAFQAFKEGPFLIVGRISERTGLSSPAANQAVARLAELGIVREITGRHRERVFAYDQYLAILNKGRRNEEVNEGAWVWRVNGPSQPLVRFPRE